MNSDYDSLVLMLLCLSLVYPELFMEIIYAYGVT